MAANSTSNPTYKLLIGLEDGSLSHKREKLDGVLLMRGLTVAHVTELREKVVLRQDDVFICTYPKCGTTWMQAIVKLIVNNGVEPGIDSDVFSPWIDHMTMEEIDSLSSPRFFKTHLPYHLMPVGHGDPATSVAKYIYIYRNPKDAAVSDYHRQGNRVDITWDQFFNDFVNGISDFGPFYDHFSVWWKHRDAANILVLSYEEMKRNLFSVVKRVCDFLGYSLTDEVVHQIVEQTSFNVMKANPASNKSYIHSFYSSKCEPFMRKGVIGDWKMMFSQEQSKRMDAVVNDKLKDTGLVFDYGN